MLSIETKAGDRGPARRCDTPAGKPLILVVEDDAGIRRRICALLRQVTAAIVIQAEDPYAAASLARAAGQPIDLLITDADLGANMTGIDLARQLVAGQPSMAVLLMSARDLPLSILPRAWQFLEKPFPIAELLHRVDELCGDIDSGRGVISAA